ncbi:hypothetical protein CNR22_13435 [Sphingobacteriaceae bacterium]|nr:hypothetical protein CNR22_13435 [Sphingobacteriaceae bacterium]
MYKDAEDLLKELFEYNLAQTAVKFGLSDKQLGPFDIKKATKLLNVAEFLSNKSGDEDKIKSFLICALLWENRQQDWHALKSFLPRVLIKIGLTTSAKMIGHNNETNAFASFGSYIEELFSTAKIINHEVSLFNTTIVLSSFQKRMWDAIDQYNRVGISAPTSAGKSFVLVNKVIELLSREPGKVVFIVPTISLINQVCNDFRKKFTEYGITDIAVSQTVNNHSLFKGDKVIYVLTQERALGALNHTEGDLDDVKILVVDEIQNVEKVANEDDERAKTLFDAIQELKNDKKPGRIIIAGPRLKNIGEIVKDLFGDDGQSVSEDIPAVLNVSYSFKKKKRAKSIYFTQHLPLGYETNIEIEDKYLLRDKILGKKVYGDEVHDFIAKIVAGDSEFGNIIFAGTTKQANETALGVAKRLPVLPPGPFIQGLKDFISETVHPNYSLIESVSKRVGFHHAKVPHHIRSLMEKTFAKKYLHTIVSTTTLMQGINLPAKNIIIRNPSIAKGQNLTGYEFTNLKGRAGRLMQDLVGRAIIIDELECNDQQISLSIQEEKNLNVGYGSRYIEGKANIDQAIADNAVVSIEDAIGNDIIIYIRNMALKYGELGFKRLHDVGVRLSLKQYQKVLEDVSKIAVPRSICFSNFYWDPLVLNNLYLSFLNKEWPEVPTKIFGCGNSLYALLEKMYEFTPIYYNKYFGITPSPIGGGKALSMCLFAESWGQGKPIKEVVNPANWPITASGDIDGRIGDLHTKVMYGLPKLLRPLFQISDLINQNKSAHLLSYIEVGAFDPKLRTLIEIGIPRESAIDFLDKIPQSNYLGEDGQIDDIELKKFIERVKASDSVNRWHKMLIEDL